MNLKNIYFSWLIYWGKMKGLLNGIAEAIILLASLASFFVLIYQFGFVQTPDSVHILERSRPFILLAFFHGHNTPVRGEVPRNHTGENVVSRYQHLFPFIRRIIQQDIFQGCHSALFALFVFPYETSLRICLIIAA